MDLVDIGANLISRQFSDDLPEVILRAREAGVGRMIVTGTDLAISERAADFADSEPGLWSTAGVHPHHADDASDAAIQGIEALLSRPSVVAVGECGLDFNRNYSGRDAQIAAFESQLGLAAQAGLPVFLHQRDAHAEFLAILRNAWPNLRAGAVVHCFTDGPAEAEDYLDLGCHLGITGWVCDERRGEALREAVPRIPGDRLMLETDAPYLLPRTIRPRPKSRRCEPQHLPWVLREVASLRGEEPTATAEAARRTTESFFGLPGGPGNAQAPSNSRD